MLFESGMMLAQQATLQTLLTTRISTDAIRQASSPVLLLYASTLPFSNNTAMELSQRFRI